MDSKFYNSLTEGDFGNGLLLRQSLLEGDFWPRPAGCHIVYCGPGVNVDYDKIQAVMNLADNQVIIAGQDLPAGTTWRYVRRQVSDCGKESPDSSVCDVVIDSAGDSIANIPNAPCDLSAQAQASGKIKLRWRYASSGQAAAPTGFRIYIDSGSGFNFASPSDTVPAPASLARSGASKWFRWTSSALSDGTLYQFCVRAYKTGGGESQNVNAVAIRADATGPTALTGLTASWEEYDG